MPISLADLVSPDYAGEIKSFPVCQLLNGAKSPKDTGLFIKLPSLVKADWKNIPKPEELYTQTFNSGESEQGILLQKPNILIFQQSPRFIETRAKKDQKSKIIGVYENPRDAEVYNSDKANYTLRTLYLIFLLNDKGEKLHSVPLCLTVKGVAAAQFGVQLDSFRQSLEKAFAEAQKIPYSPKNEQFHSLGVFTPTFEPSLEGGAEKSWVCIAKTYAPATAKDIAKFLRTDLADEVWMLRDAAKTFSARYFNDEADYFAVEGNVPMLRSATSNDGADFDTTVDVDTV